MADSNVPITAGTGTNVDTFTQASGDHRQAVVIGDATNSPTVGVTSLGGLTVQGVQSAYTSLSVTTASSSTGTVACTGYSVATVTISGTHAGINLTFEVSQDGGTTWIPVTGVQIDAFATTTNGATGVITSNVSRGWDVTLGAVDSFRVRSTAYTSGTGVVKIAFNTLPYDVAPAVGIVGTPAVTVTSGTVTANGGTSFTTPTVTTTGDTGAKTATGNGATQTNANSKGVHVTVNLGTVSGTSPTAVFKLQGSADSGTTWYDIPGATTASLTATGVFGITVFPGVTVVAGTTTTGTTAACSQPVPRSWRVVWTIGGTTPSFTITNIQVNYFV